MNLDLLHHWKACIVIAVLMWMIFNRYLSFRDGGIWRMIIISLFVLFLLGIAQDVVKGYLDKNQKVLSVDWWTKEGLKLIAKKVPPVARGLSKSGDEALVTYKRCEAAVAANYQLTKYIGTSCNGETTNLGWGNCMQKKICQFGERTNVNAPGDPCNDAMACQAEIPSNTIGPKSNDAKYTIQTYLCDWDLLPDQACEH